MHLLAIFAERGSNLLMPDASAIVIFVMALALVWVLNALLFKPLNQVLDDRDRRTRGYISEAKAMLAESDRKLAQYQEAMRQARAEVYEVLEQRRKAAIDQRGRLIDAAKQEVTEQIASARREIEAQIAEAQSELSAEAQAVANRIAGNLVGRQIGEVESW